MEWDKFSLPVVAAGDCHMIAAVTRGGLDSGRECRFVCAKA